MAGLTWASLRREAVLRIHSSRAACHGINLLCDRALLGAYAAGAADRRPRIVDKAAGEVLGHASRRRAERGG